MLNGTIDFTGVRSFDDAIFIFLQNNSKLATYACIICFVCSLFLLCVCENKKQKDDKQTNDTCMYI